MLQSKQEKVIPHVEERLIKRFQKTERDYEYEDKKWCGLITVTGVIGFGLIILFNKIF